MRSIPGIQPTVEMAVWAVEMPSWGSRSQAPSTASAFISGSPMPMNTAWLTGSLRRKWSAWSRISEDVRLRPKRIEPVAQKVQVSGQPDWLDRHSERLALDAQGGERHLLGQALAQPQRQVGHLVVGAGAAGRPFPHLAGAKARLPPVRQPLAEQCQVHGGKCGSLPAVRLAKFLAHAGVASRRAAEEIVRAGRVSVGGGRVTDPE